MGKLVAMSDQEPVEQGATSFNFDIIKLWFIISVRALALPHESDAKMFAACATRSVASIEDVGPSTKIVAESSKKISSDASLGERKPSFVEWDSHVDRYSTFGNKSSHLLAASAKHAQKDAILRPICVQGRVVRREARTRAYCGN